MHAIELDWRSVDRHDQAIPREQSIGAPLLRRFNNRHDAGASVAVQEERIGRMKKDEALKLAQDLRALADRFSEGWHEGIKIDASDIMLLADAAEALTEQPAQQQEPAGSVYRYGKDSSGKPWHGIRWTASGLDLPDGTLIYTSPPAQQQEPVAHCRVRPLRGDQSFPTVEVDWVSRPVPGPLYTSPQPSKPWVGLEEQDMPDGENPMYDDPRFIAGMVWANHKLREKNNG